MAPESNALPTDYWQRLGVRIALAGGLFPVFTGAVVWLPIGLIGLAIALIGPADWGGGILGAAFLMVSPLIYGPAMFAAGYIYTALITMAVLPLIAGSLRLSGLRPASDTLGGLSGAFVAWCALAPVGVGVFGHVGIQDPFWVVTGVVVSVLGILHGMAIGSLAGLASLRRKNRHPEKRPPLRGRISLRVLLAAMAPVSVAMAIAKALGLLTPGMAWYATLGALTVLASHRATRWAVNAWLDRCLRRRKDRRRRPTERST